MTKRTLFKSAVLALGVAFGPSAHTAARAAEPPISWDSIPFVFAGSMFGVILAIGLQIIRHDPKYGRLALGFFTPVSSFILGSGLGALAVGGLMNDFGPSSLFFFTMGLGAVCGVFLSGIMHRLKIKRRF